MKHRYKIVVVALAVIALTGCGTSHSSSSSGTSRTSQQLTNAQAQQAVQSWISQTKQAGSVSVLGIQELPQQNSAKADLQFTSLQYQRPYYGLMNFSGKGAAVFSHYSDGRWVLTTVATDNGLDSLTETTSIAVN